MSDDTTRPTLHIPSLTGVWRDVFTAREKVHRAADKAVLAAWADAVAADADVDAAAAAAVQTLAGRTFESDVQGEPSTAKGRRRRLDVLALTLAAILHRMSAGGSWEALRAVVAAQLAKAWQAGWAASRDLFEPGGADPPDPPSMTGAADTALQTASRWTVAGAAKAAAAVLVAAATSGTARKRIAAALRKFLKDPLGLRLAIDQAVSAAYGAGMRAHQRQMGVGQVQWLTAGDGAVCTACADREDASPYAIDQAPEPPEHPACRCVTVPVPTT